MAIQYGMSTDEFWKQDPELFWAYRFSYIEKKKREQEENNYQAWLQGAYIWEAVSVALSNAFSKEKISYRNVPYGIEETSKIPKQKLLEAKLKARVMQVQQVFEVKNE